MNKPQALARAWGFIENEERDSEMVGRRDVLRMGAQATAVGMAAGLTGGHHPAAAAVTTTHGPGLPAWRELRRSLSPAAGLYRRGSGDFHRLAVPDNLRYAHVLPAGIVACATKNDVRAAVRWAAPRRPSRLYRIAGWAGDGRVRYRMGPPLATGHGR